MKKIKTLLGCALTIAPVTLPLALVVSCEASPKKEAVNYLDSYISTMREGLESALAQLGENGDAAQKSELKLQLASIDDLRSQLVEQLSNGTDAEAKEFISTFKLIPASSTQQKLNEMLAKIVQNKKQEKAKNTNSTENSSATTESN